MLIIPGINQVNGQGNGILDSLFTFRKEKTKVIEALNTVSRKTGYYFTYDSRLFDPERNLILEADQNKLSEILFSIVGTDSIALKVIDRYIIISRLTVYKDEAEGASPSRAAGPGIISGTITDEVSGEPLPFATLGLKNSGRGTVSNENGEFRITIPSESDSDTLTIHYLGFIAREIPLLQLGGSNFVIAMKRDYIPIPEIIIKNQIPQEIIARSRAGIRNNYGNSPSEMTAFYREGVLKKDEIQSYSEAVLQLYKSAYTGSIFNDQIKVLKSRKIDNVDISDTLAVRLKAGLQTCLELDGARNIFDFMSERNIADYQYRLSDIVTYDDESAFAIDFEQRENIEMPLFRGTVYINTTDYAILHADFELHPGHIDEMRSTFVSSPAKGFSTWPQSVKYTVSYRKMGQRYFLNHVRGDLVFVSRQKRKLFNSQFRVFFELAITSVNTENAERFDREETAPLYSVFSRTIQSYDADFWGDQEFLKPEDNLLQALRNMKVRLQEFSEKP